MFSSLADFFRVWATESEGTQRILDVLNDESLVRGITPDDRTLGRVAWHTVTTVPEMMARTGLAFAGFDKHEPVPESAAEIAAYYRRVNAEMVESIRKQWSDDTLREEREMYGERWTIGATLFSLITHQIHHRGQMTVLMRQAGLKVPGIYGPAREEWSQFGMKPPAV